jgi:hypothetical protein
MGTRQTNRLGAVLTGRNLRLPLRRRSTAGWQSYTPATWFPSDRHAGWRRSGSLLGFRKLMSAAPLPRFLSASSMRPYGPSMPLIRSTRVRICMSLHGVVRTAASPRA